MHGQGNYYIDCRPEVKFSSNSRFFFQMRPKSVYRVEPVEGEIPPERSMEVTVTACLDDCVRYVIYIEDLT